MRKWMQMTLPRYRSVFSRLATPYTFSPDLAFGEALLAVVLCLARIFSACLLAAAWAGLSAFAWGAIASHVWRAAAVLVLVPTFLTGFVLLMLAISGLEKRIVGHR
jgi:hypothetical protein